MLSVKMEEKLNNQMNAELQSAYSYFAMAAYCRAQSLDGCGHWLELQAKEEMQHALKIYRYVVDQGATVKLLAVSSPKQNFGSLIEVFEEGLSHEKKIWELLNQIATAALEERDNTTHTFLQWFLTEQVEEVSTAQRVIEQLKLIGGNGQGLFLLDRELGGRKLEAAPTNE